jgi:predicted ATP-binding protein involved in virulence
MDNQNNADNTNTDLYFASLTLTDVKCFKGEHTINFTNEKGEYCPWTVILGNNNTGKTTILKSLFSLTPKEHEIEIVHNENITTKIKRTNPIGIVSSQLFDLEGIFSANISKREAHQTNLIKDVWSYELHKRTGETLREGYSINQTTSFIDILKLKTVWYGVGRRLNENAENGKIDISTIMSGLEFYDVEKWLVDIHLATFQEVSKIKAQEVFERAKNILTSDILPDVKDVRIQTEQKGNTSFDNFVEFLTDFGWVRINELGYGYQSMVAWLLDLVREMMELYTDSPNPLREPVTVLIDEIDLHLHPEWQRKIIAHLSKYFPKAQFIVTAHSPLIVQSAENVNVVLLQKVGDTILITQPAIHNFRGWTIDEILTEIMGMEDRIHSDYYITLMKDFETALDTDNYDLAQDTYQQLGEILHPNSHQRKLLRIQMSSLTPANAL